MYTSTACCEHPGHLHFSSLEGGRFLPAARVSRCSLKKPHLLSPFSPETSEIFDFAASTSPCILFLCLWYQASFPSWASLNDQPRLTLLDPLISDRVHWKVFLKHLWLLATQNPPAMQCRKEGSSSIFKKSPQIVNPCVSNDFI